MQSKTHTNTETKFFFRPLSSLPNQLGHLHSANPQLSLFVLSICVMNSEQAFLFRVPRGVDPAVLDGSKLRLTCSSHESENAVLPDLDNVAFAYDYRRFECCSLGKAGQTSSEANITILRKTEATLTLDSVKFAGYVSIRSKTTPIPEVLELLPKRHGVRSVEEVLAS